MATAALLATTSFAHAATSAEEFVQKAAISGKFEIESSKLALERSTDADVKAFAQKMIDDHTMADTELKSTVKKAKLANDTLPKELDDKHAKILEKLKSAKAEDFNEDYLDAQEDAHEDAVKLFKNYAEKGENADLKKFASDTLPTLEAHHHSVEALDKKDDDKLEKTAK